MAGTKHGQGGVAAHASQRRYPNELTERAVRMVLDSYDRGEEWSGTVTRIARIPRSNFGKIPQR